MIRTPCGHESAPHLLVADRGRPVGLEPTDMANHTRAQQLAFDFSADAWQSMLPVEKPGADPSRWAPEMPKHPDHRRQRARRRFLMGPCFKCGKPGKDRHHKNDDVSNNEPDNIAILCRRCHMEIDGRLAKIGTYFRPPTKPPTPCVSCGKPARPSRKGLCASCYSSTPEMKAYRREWAKESRRRARS